MTRIEHIAKQLFESEYPYRDFDEAPEPQRKRYMTMALDIIIEQTATKF